MSRLSVYARPKIDARAPGAKGLRLRNTHYGMGGEVLSGTDQMTGDRVTVPRRSGATMPDLGRTTWEARQNDSAAREAAAQFRQRPERFAPDVAQAQAAAVTPGPAGIAMAAMSHATPFQRAVNATLTRGMSAPPPTPKAVIKPDPRNNVADGFVKYGRIGRAAEVVNNAVAAAPASRDFLSASARLDSYPPDARVGLPAAHGVMATQSVEDAASRETARQVAQINADSARSRFLRASSPPPGSPVLNEGAGGRTVVTRQPDMLASSPWKRAQKRTNGLR